MIKFMITSSVLVALAIFFLFWLIPFSTIEYEDKTQVCIQSKEALTLNYDNYCLSRER